MPLDNRRGKALAALEADLPRKFFTIEQANRSLVLVSRVVCDIVAHFDRLLELQDAMDRAERTHARQSFIRVQEDIRSTFGRLQRCRQEIEDMGATLKDWGKGIVHFPCIAHGREIYLCWRFNEPQIAFWHEIGSCLADRRPILTLTGLGQYIAEPGRAGISDTPTIRRA